MAIRIGVSGWRYRPWRGMFYPAGLGQRRELEYAAARFGSIEINGSFYSLQSPRSYSSWRDAAPRGFVFAVKAPRYITHVLRLRDADKALANFFASGVLRLHAKLGPILWQLPPGLRFDPALIDGFLAKLPRDSAQALVLARRRDVARMRGRSALAIDRKRRLRHVIEVRHPSFGDPAFVALLRRHGVALAVADTGGTWPYFEDITAGFLYLRLHGDTELYASGYSDAALERWAARIRAWADGGQPDDARLIGGARPVARRRRDVYCYFDNDAKGHAPFDALALMGKLGLPARCNARRPPWPSALRRPRLRPAPAPGSWHRHPAPA